MYLCTTCLDREEREDDLNPSLIELCEGCFQMRVCCEVVVLSWKEDEEFDNNEYL